MRVGMRLVSMFCLMMTMAGCGGTSTAPSPSPAPARLEEFWVGTVGARSDDGRPLGIIWSATESGNVVSGTATFATLTPTAAQITFVGPLTGTRNGNELSLTYVATYGTVLAGTCALTGFGTATVSGVTLTGSLSVIPGSCDSLGLQPPTTTELTLTKQ